MKQLLIASGLTILSLAAATSAEAACRQVYGGTSCNWLGKCWHNPPKTVCDPAPVPRPAPIAQRPMVQPGSNLISNKGGGILVNNGGNLISENRGWIISDHASGAVGNKGSTAGAGMRR